MAALTLNESAAVTLDASGNGTVTAGPNVPGVVWYVSQVATWSSSTTGPTFYLYYNGASPGNLLGGSYSGNLDSTDLSVVLFCGQFLTGVYSGGTAGASAVMSIYGTKQTPG